MSQRAQWKSEHMANAVEAVKKGKLSQRAAADRYKIPRRTLRNHILSKSNVRKLGREPTIPKEDEKELVRRIIRMSDIGLPLTPKIVRQQAFIFCESNKIPHKFNNAIAGYKWFKPFMKRNPDVARRRAQTFNPSRAQKLNKVIVKDHFDKFEALLIESGLYNRPECIFNMDEKGCRLNVHQQIVLAAKGSKRVRHVSNEHAENVTVVGCVNAIGQAIPPMILFKGKRYRNEYQDNLPAGSIVRLTAKGYMTTDIFVEFIVHLSKFKPASTCILVFDGAKSHLDYRIVEEADKHQIVLFCLPSNTTHELQPLDKSVYRSFEHHWDEEALKFLRLYPDRPLNKTSFGLVLSKVWPKCMTQTNIVNGFRATGLYPFNREAIPEIAFAPSIPTELPPDYFEPSHIDEPDQQTSLAPDASHEESDDSENIPLALLARKPTLSFSTMLATPKTQKKKSIRKKAINYKAQIVTKQLFD